MKAVLNNNNNNNNEREITLNSGYISPGPSPKYSPKATTTTTTRNNSGLYMSSTSAIPRGSITIPPSNITIAAQGIHVPVSPSPSMNVNSTVYKSASTIEKEENKKSAIKILEDEIKALNNNTSSLKSILDTDYESDDDAENHANRLETMINALTYLFENYFNIYKKNDYDKELAPLMKTLATKFGGVFDTAEEFGANLAQTVLKPYFDQLENVDIRYPLPIYERLPSRTPIQYLAINILTNYITQLGADLEEDDAQKRLEAKRTFLENLIKNENNYYTTFMDKKRVEAEESAKIDAKEAYERFQEKILTPFEQGKASPQKKVINFNKMYDENKAHLIQDKELNSYFQAYLFIRSLYNKFSGDYLNGINFPNIREDYKAAVNPVEEIMDNFLLKFIPLLLDRAPLDKDSITLKKYYDQRIKAVQDHLRIIIQLNKQNEPSSSVLKSWNSKKLAEYQEKLNKYEKYTALAKQINDLLETLSNMMKYEAEKYERQLDERELARPFVPKKKSGQKSRRNRRIGTNQEGNPIYVKMASFPSKPYYSSATRKIMRAQTRGPKGNAKAKSKKIKKVKLPKK